MGVFDQAARYAGKLDPAGFLRWLLATLDTNLLHGWLDTHTIPFPGESDRICDTVAGYLNALAQDDPWAVVVEFQTEPDAEMLDRLLEYLARLRRELRYGPNRSKYRVAAALVNLTGPPQADRLEMWLPGMTDIGLRLHVTLRTMRAQDAAATLAGIAEGRVARCLLPWIPLMHGAGELSIIEQWKQLAESELDTRLRSDYAGLALVFAELTGLRPFWKHALEGWNVRQSQQVLEWQAEARIEGRT